MNFFNVVQNTKNIEDSKNLLYFHFPPTEKIKKAVEFCIKAHENQFRKSGEPYSVHPLLVSSIVAYMGGNETMIVAALLHDIVEDTTYSIEDVDKLYGNSVAQLVDGLTKIDSIREKELLPSTSNEKLIISALSFRKMLLASIEDIRVLVIKLCDRVHNMLTLDALPQNKQIRIAEETLVVYAPISHRLGISTIKNILEDLSFKYIFPEEYSKIDDYFKSHEQKIDIKLNNFISKIEDILDKDGFEKDSYKISTRIKHHYSIYLKMQRKGVSIEEVLDLMAIRILVNTPVDCYKVLGLVHTNFKPLIARFKDYIAIPKENGYQTLHTTVFNNSSIFEVQIRTYDMHKSAEYGVAAHWKYKSAGLNPNMEWLHNLELQNDSIEEFYDLVKSDLYSEDISVQTPKGELRTLPRGATALDFAYSIHSDIGDRAKFAYINRQKSPLLTELKNGDIVKIETEIETITRCSWIDAVKTTRAKTHMRINCNHKLKDIDKKSAINILATIFDKEYETIEKTIEEKGLTNSIYKLPNDIGFLKDVKSRLKNKFKHNSKFLSKFRIARLNLREFTFDNILVYSNNHIAEISFDYCCHPKRGDMVVGFKSKNKVFIHHKLCDIAQKKMNEHEQMVFVKWIEDKLHKYKIVVSLENKKGALANFLIYLAKIDVNVLSIKLAHDDNSHIEYFELNIETEISNSKTLTQMLDTKVKVIEIASLNDAYNN
ncbi:MAG: bifunctional (p)ppGpp synthetase/guanosine-3',5'-bis(diphosphate) 3'-pyrophosphohydrolase [Campylobacterales bacterium]|nr:bifunctional (p)ppGpp synthetase/guanosine-3',5'-bis(diphosphate) 3'-pyrophosphohydrolase [Campylobacterales bacterium]